MENPTKVRSLTLDNISSNNEKTKIRFSLKDRIEILILILINTFYLFYSLLNLVNLNNMRIYYYNKD